MKTLIKGGTIVNEGEQKKANIIIEDDRIKEIYTEGIGTESADSFDSIVDATDCFVIPGVIDTHVHFREPGMTHKADMETESRAAAYGGVTSVFEMPNTNPQTTTIAALQDKESIAQHKMHVNYTFFPGATNDNIDELRQLDIHKVPGIKLFMGSSTGNMLVDKEKALDAIFSLAKEKGLPIMAHCEDTDTINANMERIKKQLKTDDPPVTYHPLVRDRDACYKSSQLAQQLALRYNAQLHIAHISTDLELPLLEGNITGEATVAHLLFSVVDYDKYGTRIKCNPSIKSINDQLPLRKALAESADKGTVNGLCTIGTDHAPHTLSEKEGGCAKAVSGMPMVQFSLIAMLSLVDEGDFTIPQLVTLMCHNPATIFSLDDRGFLRQGAKADITIVKRSETPWALTKDCIQSKCGWSPLEGMEFHWKVQQTIINGHLIYNNGAFNGEIMGEPLTFRSHE